MSWSSKENKQEALSTSGALVAIIYNTSVILFFWGEKKFLG